MNRYQITALRGKLARSVRALSVTTTPRPLNYLDIGARDGIPRRWRVLERAGRVRPIYVEADEVEAKKLERNGRVLCAALGGQDDLDVELKVTRAPWLTSLLEPIPERWPAELAAGCEVVDRRKMTVSRLDSVWPTEYGDPHFVKVDTQGYDLEVLRGFGDLLDGVLCAEVEVRISEQYVGQCLASDIYNFMNDKGFDMVGLLSNGLQAGSGMMVFNAFFIRASARDTSAVKLWRIVNNIGSIERVKALGF